MKFSSFHEALIVVVLASGFFLYFRSPEYDTNGIVDAQAVEAGQLLHHNHLLYRPLGYVLWVSATHAGYTGRAIDLLQVVNAIVGAVGIGAIYAVFRQISPFDAAVIGAVWLATSSAYWYFSTDVAYITLAAAFLALSLAALLCTTGRWRWLLSGSCLGLSVLTWQAAVFAMPGVLLVGWDKSPKRLLSRALMLAAGLVAITYVAIGIVAYGHWSPAALFRWLTQYGSGVALPLWGVWSAERIGPLLHSAAASIVPIGWFDAMDIFRPPLQFGRLAVHLSPMALLILIAWPVLSSARRMPDQVMDPSKWIAPLAAYLAFLPFILWWDPFEPKWFLVPNIFFACFLVGMWGWQSRRAQVIFLGSTLTIAVANLVVAMPSQRDMGEARSLAACVAGNIQSGDAILAAEWGWPDYLPYFHDVVTLNMINEAAGTKDKQEILAAVDRLLMQTRSAGSAVYAADPGQFSQAHLDWLSAQTDITPADLDRLHGEPAFVCGTRAFVAVDRR